MEDLDKKNDSFFEESREYLNAQIALLKLDTIEKLTQIIQSILLLLLTIILVGGAVFYLSVGFIWWYNNVFGGVIPALLIVSGGYILLLLAFYIFRKNLIINPLVKLFSRIFFTTTNDITDDQQ